MFVAIAGLFVSFWGFSWQHLRRIDGLEAKFDNKLDGLETKFDNKLDGLETKFDNKFDELSYRVSTNGERLARIEGFLGIGLSSTGTAAAVADPTDSLAGLPPAGASAAAAAVADPTDSLAGLPPG